MNNDRGERTTFLWAGDGILEVGGFPRLSSTQGDPLSPRFRSGFRLAFRCCPWVTPIEEDKIELTHTPSLSMRANQYHTKETFFMAGDTAPSQATNGQARGPQDGVPTEP